MIENEVGGMFRAIDVFSLSIAALVDDMLKASSSTVSRGISQDDVHWVITEPGIWSDATKQFMKVHERSCHERTSTFSFIRFFLSPTSIAFKITLVKKLFLSFFLRHLLKHASSK